MAAMYHDLKSVKKSFNLCCKLFNSDEFVHFHLLFDSFFPLANAWEEEDEIVLITCRMENPNLDMASGAVKEKLYNISNELYVK